MKLKKIKIKQINIEVAPASENQQASLLETEQNEQPVHLTLGENGKYDIIDGRRRIVDTLAIGRDWVYAIIKENIDEENLAAQALILNSGSENHMDEADHIWTLQQKGWSIEGIAKHCNVTTQTIYDRLRLKERLIPAIQEYLRAGTIKYSAALEFTHLPEDRQQEAVKALAEGKQFKLKDVKELKRNYQTETTHASLQFPLFEDVPEYGPGLFIPNEQMKALMQGLAIEIEFQSKTIKIGLTSEEGSNV